jgi:hypothetical protein
MRINQRWWGVSAKRIGEILDEEADRRRPRLIVHMLTDVLDAAITNGLRRRI